MMFTDGSETDAVKDHVEAQTKETPYSVGGGICIQWSGENTQEHFFLLDHTSKRPNYNYRGDRLYRIG